MTRRGSHARMRRGTKDRANGLWPLFAVGSSRTSYRCWFVSGVTWPSEGTDCNSWLCMHVFVFYVDSCVCVCVCLIFFCYFEYNYYFYFLVVWPFRKKLWGRKIWSGRVLFFFGKKEQLWVGIKLKEGGCKNEKNVANSQQVVLLLDEKFKGKKIKYGSGRPGFIPCSSWKKGGPQGACFTDERRILLKQVCGCCLKVFFFALIEWLCFRHWGAQARHGCHVTMQLKGQK